MNGYSAGSADPQPPETSGPSAPSGNRLTALIKVVLVLVIVNALLCLGAAAFLWFSRSGQPAAATPTAIVARATATPTRTPIRTPAATQTRVVGPVTAAPTRPPETARPANPPAPVTVTVIASRPPQPTVAPTRTPAPSAGGIILNDPSLQELLNTIVNAPAGKGVQVTLSEKALGSEIRSSLGANPGYQHESVQLRDGRMLLVGRGQVQGITARVETTVRPYASNCRLALEVERMRVGGLPAPRFLIDQVAAGATQWSDAYVNAVNFCVEQVAVADGRLVFAGRVQ